MNTLPDLDARFSEDRIRNPNSSNILEERRNFQVLKLNFFENSASSGAVTDTETPQSGLNRRY